MDGLINFENKVSYKNMSEEAGLVNMGELRKEWGEILSSRKE